MNSFRSLVAAVAGWLSLGTGTSAQSVPPSVAPPPQEEAIVWSPFQVNATSDNGDQVSETIAGGRLRTELKVVSAQVDVMAQEYLSNLGINSLVDALRFSLTGKFRTVTFILSDARFSGQGYTGSDLQIQATTGGAVIRLVRVINLR